MAASSFVFFIWLAIKIGPDSALTYTGANPKFTPIAPSGVKSVTKENPAPYKGLNPVAEKYKIGNRSLLVCRWVRRASLAIRFQFWFDGMWNNLVRRQGILWEKGGAHRPVSSKAFF